MSGSRVITLTTDFGHKDFFAGVMKGVILSIHPEVSVVDLTHGIGPQNVREAAYVIGMNYRYFPRNSVHVAVVDPGVGSQRRPILVKNDFCCFVGPDNGIFSLIYEESGEAVRVYRLTASRYFLAGESPTFQGRDVFAPVAAHLARDMDVTAFGDEISDYVKIELPRPRRAGSGGIEGEIVYIDTFGNAITNICAGAAGLPVEPDGLPVGRAVVGNHSVKMKRFYSEAAGTDLCCLLNSSGCLEFFVFSRSASDMFGLSVGDPVRLMLS